MVRILKKKTKQNFKLLVLDVDNTLFDWVSYYVHAYGAMLHKVSNITGISVETLSTESKIVFENHGSIEFPFVLQELPSVTAHYGDDVDGMLQNCVAPARDVFRTIAIKKLQLYEGVLQALEMIKRERNDLPIVALTDAPRYVAMWKLNKLGVLHVFDAVYGLTDPKIPTDQRLGRIKVDAEILLKHLQQNNFGFKGRIRTLPEEYEKPGIRGLKTVLMDYGLDGTRATRKKVLWVGDNIRKDIGLGTKLGVVSAWAKYGTNIPDEMMQALRAFSPERNIHKNANVHSDHPEAAVADIILENFADILVHLVADDAKIASKLRDQK